MAKGVYMRKYEASFSDGRRKTKTFHSRNKQSAIKEARYNWGTGFAIKRAR